MPEEGAPWPLITLGSFPECCLKPPPSREMRGEGVRLQSFTGLTAGCHGNGGTRRRLGTGPALAHWLAQAPRILIPTPPSAQVGRGAFWAVQTQPQFTHLLLWARIPSMDPLGGLQVAGKGATVGPSSPRSPGTSNAPDAQGLPGGRWAENDSKLEGRTWGPG